MGESVDLKKSEYFTGQTFLRDCPVSRFVQGKVQLIYIDPPFMTGQLFRYRQNEIKGLLSMLLTGINGRKERFSNLYETSI